MNTKKFGYVRVSSKDQNIARQIKDLTAIGIDERDIFIDKQSGKDFDRPQYQALKQCLRQGDVLYVKSLDRFGRNKEQILDEWKDITKIIKADIVVLDMPLLDTTRYKDVSGLENLITDIVLQLLSYFAEEERTRIKIRQAEGIAVAKDRGTKFGRPQITFPKDFETIYASWKTSDITAIKAMEQLNLKKTTFYKLVKQYERRNN